MKLFLCTSDAGDPRYCLVTSHGSPLSDPLATGEPIAPVMEEFDEHDVRLELDENDGGLDRPDMVGNDQNYLILRRACADAILAAFSAGPHDVTPVTLVNKKKRVHADDYVVVNPHGQVECLDRARSEMNKDAEAPAVRIFGKFWLRTAAVPADRDIFRVRGLLIGYVFSERLVEFISAHAFTNFVFEPIQLS